MIQDLSKAKKSIILEDFEYFVRELFDKYGYSNLTIKIINFRHKLSYNEKRGKNTIIQVIFKIQKQMLKELK